MGRADGKRGRGRCAGKGWTGLEFEPWRVGVPVGEDGAATRSLIGTGWIAFGRRRSL